MNKISRQNFSELAANQIRSWILSLHLKPGDRMIVEDLAEKMGVSRTPVREGLRCLADEGLVIYDGKSYIVRQFTKMEIEDIFAIRHSLELLSAKQAAERTNLGVVEKMRKLLNDFEGNGSAKDIESYISCDIRFHELICEASGNSRLQQMLGRLNEQCWWISRIVFSSDPSTYTKNMTVAAHRKLLEFIQAGNPEKAITVMEKHLIEGEKRKIGNLFPREAPI